MFEQTFKNFQICFRALNERNTFSSGDPITGQISFELTKETKITVITVKLTGKANVHWSTGGGRSGRRHYSARLDFFDFKGVIMQENTGMRSVGSCGCSVETWQTTNHCSVKSVFLLRSYW